jgi:hypothetical protein
MRKLVSVILIAAMLVPTAAYADWDGHRHWDGPRPGYNHGGGDAGAALFGGIVGGLILGGMINSMNQPQYYGQPQYVQPQTFCRMEPAYDQYGNYVGRIRRCYTQ